jgi:S-adenosylmethionine:tRNA ribosyltransferase-isomerase
MRTADFDYHLPPDRIAQHPVARGTSRMLVLERKSGEIAHRDVTDLPEYLGPGDLMLANDTRVIPARLYARRSTGRVFELLLLRRVEGQVWEALLRPAARARRGERLELENGDAVSAIERLEEGRWRVRFEPELTLEGLDRIGHTPLPPYIQRGSGELPTDRGDYQTLYAAEPGAVAAPTAGLHFTEEILESVRAAGAELAYLTLHVGLGTFRPVAVEQVEEHRMHSEWFRITDATAAAIRCALTENRRILCVGTTTVRALEGAMAVEGGRIAAGESSTDLFITPGFPFRGTGAMLTNFHLPRSTLLMMVSAFAGRERVLGAYEEAIGEGYRFYSYGDAMLIV